MISLFVLLLSLTALVHSSPLNEADKARFEKVLAPAWQLDDVNSLMFASSSYKHLGLTPPKKEAACAFVRKTLEENPSTEVIFQSSSAASNLGCSVTASNEIEQTLSNSVSDKSSMAEIYQAVMASSHLRIPIDSAKVLGAVHSALKRDDGVLSLAHSFHVGAQLSGDMNTLFERIEDALVQADEVDGRFLQFEGGLSITAHVVDGIYKLCSKINRPLPVRTEQAVKFAAYLLSRKNVQVAKSIHYLLHALTTLTANKHHLPVSASISSSIAVSDSQPKIQVTVTDLLGQSIPQGVSVMADSITSETGRIELASNKPLKPVSSSVFELDVMAMKPERGFYNLVITAKGKDARLVGNEGFKLKFKVLSSFILENVKFGSGDIDQAASMKSIEFLSKPTLLEVDVHQKMLVKFTIRDESSKKLTKLHQTFVRFMHKESKRELIFLAEADSSNNYKFELGVSASEKEFGGLSGIYSVELIIGDATISNPMMWHFADLKMAFPDKTDSPPAVDYTYKARPEISHIFQKPETRPPALVSAVFTGLCLLPLLVLLVLWAKLGVNLSNFKFNLTTIGFHLGLGGIFGLYLMFWLQMNMFTTLRYLCLVGSFTFYCGNGMLSRIARARNQNSK